MIRLFDSIVEANQRTLSGDKTAKLDCAAFRDSLPVVALTCIDSRLNRLLPDALGIPEEHFIWLRNAGNIITGTLSSTLRSLALACVVKGGKEIALIGHTDCRVRQTSIGQLIDAFQAQGVERPQLPDNLVEFFGMFASERQNVLKGVDYVRTSPLIGPRIPVHGFLMDVQTGALEWLVNGYQALGTSVSRMESRSPDNKIPMAPPERGGELGLDNPDAFRNLADQLTTAVTSPPLQPATAPKLPPSPQPILPPHDVRHSNTKWRRG